MLPPEGAEFAVVRISLIISILGTSLVNALAENLFSIPSFIFIIFVIN